MFTINQKVMKTRKIILSIVGIALATLCFGQPLSQNSSDILFYSAHYDASFDRFEHRVHSYPARTISEEQSDAPILSRTYYLPRERDMLLEPWMTSPFENTFLEEDMPIETWMVAPFENSYAEPELTIERWMTQAFVLDQEMELESWMKHPWN